MENIISKIERYESACQGLCDKIETYVEWVKANVPAEYREQFGVSLFAKGKEFAWWSAHRDYNPIHSDIEKAGVFFYACGDYNYPMRHASREQIIRFAKSLPVVQKQAEEWLDSQIEVAESL